jgi:hypothetical protein
MNNNNNNNNINNNNNDNNNKHNHQHHHRHTNTHTFAIFESAPVCIGGKGGAFGGGGGGFPCGFLVDAGLVVAGLEGGLVPKVSSMVSRGGFFFL